MAHAQLFGTIASPGFAIGPARLLHAACAPQRRSIGAERVAAEQERLRAASEATRRDLRKIMDKVPEALADYCDVIAAQMEIAHDPKLLKTAARRIADELVAADWALNATMEELCALFRNMDDPVFRDRAQDIRTVVMRMRRNLAGATGIAASGAPCILVAEDLSPADVMDMNFAGVTALVTARGGPTSHTAILARSLRIPALVGVSDVLAVVHDGDRLVADGIQGLLMVLPDEDERRRYAARREEYGAWEAHVHSTSRWPAETRDGVRIGVHANIEQPSEMEGVRDCGAEGVGLYRTEFSFLADLLPGEDDLLEEYGTVAALAAPSPVIFRTLDVGADKMMRVQTGRKEPNPALGLRGIRFCLQHRHLFRAQLRALMRVGVSGNVALLLPMISTLEEVRAVRDIIRDLHGEMLVRGIPHVDNLPLGVMIETPAAVLISDALARECDFFSIGTNDLIHYLMAIDRTNHQVAYLNDALHPAVARALKRTIDAAHREGIGVSVCGELAADPHALALLIGMGVDSVSASPRFVAGMKHLIRHLDAAACMNLAYAVLMSTDTSASRRMLREGLQETLGAELDFHTTSIANA